MILFTCSRCGQTLPAPIGKISCSCGHTFTKEAVKNNHNTVNKTTMLCVHRKSVIARAECDCGAAPPVYGCELHTYAMKREYPHAPAGVLIRPEGKSQFIHPGYCDRCPDYKVIDILPTDKSGGFLDSSRDSLGGPKSDIP